MECYSCNILYNWEKRQHYLCAKFFDHASFNRGASWYFCHGRAFIEPNMVEAFLRGFAKGSRYGPQLHELNHHCKSFHEGGDIDKSLDARVVRGKLLLHGVYKLSVSLSAQSPDTLTSPVDISQNVPEGLVPAIDKFKTIGCAHTGDSLPAVILDAYELRVDCSDGRTRSLDLLNCGHCATDLRVRVELECGGTCVQIEVEIWQSFGARESDNRNKTEDAQFYDECRAEEPFDINHPPDRNLEEMFKAGVDEECDVLWSPDQSRRHQSWLQLWRWYLDPCTGQLYRYYVHSNGDGRPARMQEQALPLQTAAQ